MRDYQTKANVGALPDSNSATKLGAGEATSMREESKNAVTPAGLVLAPQDGTGEDVTQLAQSIFIHAVKSLHFADVGAVNVIELVPVSGVSGVTLPPVSDAYANLDGAHFTFDAAFTNTIAGVTVSIGQTAGTQYAALSVTREDGSALVVGDISTAVENEIRLNLGSNRFELIRGAGPNNPFDQDLNTPDSVTFAGLTVNGNINQLSLSAFPFTLESTHPTNTRFVFKNTAGPLVQTDLQIGQGAGTNDIFIGTNFLGVSEGFIDNRTPGDFLIRLFGTEKVRVGSSLVSFADGISVGGNITGNGSVPPGGTTDQIVTKNSGTDYDYDWADNTALEDASPIGTIYKNSTDATNPGTLLGFGTWVAISAGRMMLGVGTGGGHTITAGQTGGSINVTLAIANLATHTHSFRQLEDGNDGGTEDAPEQGANAQVENGVTNGTGSNVPFNILNPFLGVYMWERVA